MTGNFQKIFQTKPPTDGGDLTAVLRDEPPEEAIAYVIETEITELLSDD